MKELHDFVLSFDDHLATFMPAEEDLDAALLVRRHHEIRETPHALERGTEILVLVCSYVWMII